MQFQLVLSVTMFLRGLKKKKAVTDPATPGWLGGGPAYLAKFYDDHQAHTTAQRLALWNEMYPGVVLHMDPNDKNYDDVRLGQFEYQHLFNMGFIEVHLC